MCQKGQSEIHIIEADYNARILPIDGNKLMEEDM